MSGMQELSGVALRAPLFCDSIILFHWQIIKRTVLGKQSCMFKISGVYMGAYFYLGLVWMLLPSLIFKCMTQ
jgi:hypothetical protein